METRRNRFDRHDALEQGDRAEACFAAAARHAGFVIERAASQHDIDHHWDFRLSRSGRTFLVDVKAMKRIRRTDPQVQDGWHWIELHGVRKDDRGWLFNGRADYIAFETVREFILVPRQTLAGFVQQRVQTRTVVHAPDEAPFRVYCRRPGGTDRLTLLPVESLKALTEIIVPKSSSDIAGQEEEYP